MNGDNNQSNPRVRAIISIIETVAFAVALIAAAVHDGHWGNAITILGTLSGLTAHSINHTSGGSPV